MGWYAEVAELRQKLGLAPGPSFLKWKETLPHMAFALLLCLVVPLALRLCSNMDDWPLVPIALASTLFGNALGAKNRARKKSGGTGC